MGPTPRAVRALLLLAGFYLLGVILLAALAGVDAAAFAWLPVSVAGKLAIVSLLLAIPVVRGMFMIRRPKEDEPVGLKVGEADEPRLWALVRELAQASGTRVPDEIVLTPDVNAAVSEHPRLLGLLPGPRRLHLGVPLLTGLSEAQLRAVLAHEYGHFTGGDTRLSALVVRGRTQIGRTIEQFRAKADAKQDKERTRQEKADAKRLAKGKKTRGTDVSGAGATYRAMAGIYTWYGNLYLRASLSTAREQEFAADLASARIAGRDAAASALREIPVLDSAHDFYLESYATLGAPAGLLPPRGEFFGGFGRLLTARELQLADARTELPTEPVSPYDSHPPIAERVRRIEALPADGRTDEAKGAALGVLADVSRTLVALEDAALSDEARAMRRADGWQELLDASMSERLTGIDTPLHRALAMHTKARPTLASLLTVIDDGQVWRMARRLPLSEEAAAAKGRAFREFVRPSLRGLLTTMILSELTAQSLLTWEFSWSEAAVVRLPGDSGSAEALDAAVEAALADHPDTRALRALLPPTVGIG